MNGSATADYMSTWFLNIIITNNWKVLNPLKERSSLNIQMTQKLVSN